MGLFLISTTRSTTVGVDRSVGVSYLILSIFFSIYLWLYARIEHDPEQRNCPTSVQNNIGLAALRYGDSLGIWLRKSMTVISSSGATISRLCRRRSLIEVGFPLDLGVPQLADLDILGILAVS